MNLKELFWKEDKKEEVPNVIFLNEETENAMNLFLEERNFGRTAYTLGRILKKMGLDAEDAVTLSIEELKGNQKFVFLEGSTKNSRENITLILEDENPMNAKRIFMGTKKRMQVYEYIPADLFNKRIHLNLTKEILKREFQNMQLEETLESYKNSFQIQDENGYQLQLDIQDPIRLERNQVFHVAEEEKIQEFLLQIEFPIDILEIYKQIRQKIKNYPHIHLKYTTPEKAISFLTINNDNLTRLKIYRKGKEIYYYEKEGWKYSSSKFQLEENIDGGLDYSMTIASKNHIFDTTSLKGEIENAVSEVEKVKKRSQSIFR